MAGQPLPPIRCLYLQINKKAHLQKPPPRVTAGGLFLYSNYQRSIIMKGEKSKYSIEDTLMEALIPLCVQRRLLRDLGLAGAVAWAVITEYSERPVTKDGLYEKSMGFFRQCGLTGDVLIEGLQTLVDAGAINNVKLTETHVYYYLGSGEEEEQDEA